MSRKLLCHFVLFISISNAYGWFRNDYTFNKDAEGWLKLHTVPVSFKEAFYHCILEGAVLASPLNDGLKTALASYAESIDTVIYTGIHAYFSYGDFTSIEGIPISSLSVDWTPSENKNYRAGDNCLIMLENGTLYDVGCNNSFPYACYKKKTKNLVITECGTIDPDYKLDKRTGSCYKFHRVGMTWRRAQMDCFAEGGHLAIINSETEAKVIKEVFNKYPEENLVGTEFHDEANIGFLDWGLNGQWFTIHGQPLEDSGYNKWSSGTPNNVTRNGVGQHCGSVNREGYLNDFWCDESRLAFICEKATDSLGSFDEQ